MTEPLQTAANGRPAGPRRTALVTGASAGIGEAFARVCADHGHDVVLVARRREKLDALAAQLRERHGISTHVVVADLADRDASARLVDDLDARGLAIDLLVNNAGYAVARAYARSEWHEQERFLQVMVTAVCELTHRLLPAMMSRHYGRIVNVSSLSALLPGIPGHTLYAGAKAFLVRFSEALAVETRGHGIHVCAVCPGMTYTEFHDVTGTRTEVERAVPRFLWMDAETVAREGYDAVMAGRMVWVPGLANRTIARLAGMLPERLVYRLSYGASRKMRGR
jgi:short-subunit dehydrogenase